MCGIAGFFSPEGFPAEHLERMTQALRHRGPDDQGFFGIDLDGKPVEWKRAGEAPPVKLRWGLGFRRLAILDLSPLGAQPMRSPDGRYRIAFNGEIYNYIELAKQLGDVTFRSRSDTEV